VILLTAVWVWLLAGAVFTALNHNAAGPPDPESRWYRAHWTRKTVVLVLASALWPVGVALWLRWAWRARKAGAR
jgi:hypothetical protein